MQARNQVRPFPGVVRRCKIIQVYIMTFSFKSFNGTEVFTSLYVSGFDIGEAEGDSPT